MVTLDTLLIACSISGAAGVVFTLCVVLLIGIFFNTRSKEDEGQFAIPLSSLVGGPPGGGGGGMHLVDAYRAAQAAHAAGQTTPPEDKKKDDDKVLSGTYL